MTRIPKEVPQGAIDGVNKIFKLSNNPQYIDDIFFDGAIYVDFRQDSNDKTIIILDDAPKGSLLVDYNTTTETKGSDYSSFTFGDIKAEVWDLLGQTSDSTNFNDNKLSLEINNIANEIWIGRIVNRLNPQQIFRSGNLYFRDATTNIKIENGSALTKNLLVGDNTAKMDTKFLLPKGYLEIGGEIIKYESVTSDGISGVSGQTVEHLEGDKVVQLYEMPVNMKKPTKVELIKKSKELRAFNIPYDDNETYAKYFKILRVGEKILLKVEGLQQDDNVKISYMKRYAEMTKNTDVGPFPGRYNISVLASIVAGSLGYDKGMIHAQQHLNSGYNALNTMYSDFNDEINVVVQSIKPKSYEFNSIRNSVRGFRGTGPYGTRCN